MCTLSYATYASMQGRYAWSHDVNVELWEGRAHGHIIILLVPKV